MINKLFYYTRILLFIVYLIIMLLLINNIYKLETFSIIFYLSNLIYSFLIILSILSKKRNFKNNITFNLLNIGVYIYIFTLYTIVKSNSALDIVNNVVYFRNNFIMITTLLIGITVYLLILNQEEKL